MLELKSVQTRVIWGGTSEFAKSNRWNGGVRSVYVIHYISKGAGTLETEGKTFRLTAGDSFIIYPDTYVKYYPDENDPWEYLWVDFAGISIKDILSSIDISKNNPVFPAKNNSPIEFFETLAQTLYDNKHNYQYRSLKRLSCLYSILSYYSEHYPKRSSLQEGSFFDTVLNYINNNQSSLNLSVSSISKALNIDRSTLFRIFQKNLNQSPNEYIAELKTKTACEMLATTNLTIKSIAKSVGFDDPLYFSRFFKQHIGCSPREFRQNNLVK